MRRRFEAMRQIKMKCTQVSARRGAVTARTVPCCWTRFRRTRTENLRSQLVWLDGYLGCAGPGKTAGVPSSPLIITGLWRKKKKRNERKCIWRRSHMKPARSCDSGLFFSDVYLPIIWLGETDDDIWGGGGSPAASFPEEAGGLHLQAPLPF